MDELDDIHASSEEEIAALRSRFRERAQNINNKVEMAIGHLIKGVLSPIRHRRD